MPDLWNSYLTNKAKPIHKWKHYFPAYERHLDRFKNLDVTLVEIGCGEGGSLQMWKRYLGPHAKIVGIDIREACASFIEDQIDIRIGDQSDTAFLQSVIDGFGIPDVVIDDGSHIMHHINTTFDFYTNSCPKTAFTSWKICIRLIGVKPKEASSAGTLLSRGAKT